jgi:hypothetical protein
MATEVTIRAAQEPRLAHIVEVQQKRTAANWRYELALQGQASRTEYKRNQPAPPETRAPAGQNSEWCGFCPEPPEPQE